ncbi:MAG: hypothetical protein FXF54_04955 [Kosmotoga sp.]|nr:MAG: hypothetical protein FXF54_04955 [Kosmotoga sp.]
MHHCRGIRYSIHEPCTLARTHGSVRGRGALPLSYSIFADEKQMHTPPRWRGTPLKRRIIQKPLCDSRLCVVRKPGVGSIRRLRSWEYLV